MDSEQKDIFQLAKEGNRVRLESLLYETPFVLNIKNDDNGMTALMYASMGGHSQICEFLIKKGCELNSIDKGKLTALMYAAMHGDGTTITVLTDAGADLNLQDKNGWTALIWAVVNDHSEAVKCLLVAGANVEVTDYIFRWTAIHHAASLTRTAPTLLLLRHRADPFATDAEGLTAIDLCTCPELAEEMVSMWEEGMGGASVTSFSCQLQTGQNSGMSKSNIGDGGLTSDGNNKGNRVTGCNNGDGQPVCDRQINDIRDNNINSSSSNNNNKNNNISNVFIERGDSEGNNNIESYTPCSVTTITNIPFSTLSSISTVEDHTKLITEIVSSVVGQGLEVWESICSTFNSDLEVVDNENLYELVRKKDVFLDAAQDTPPGSTSTSVEEVEDEFLAVTPELEGDMESEKPVHEEYLDELLSTLFEDDFVDNLDENGNGFMDFGVFRKISESVQKWSENCVREQRLNAEQGRSLVYSVEAGRSEEM